MAGSINKVILIGNVGKDPDIRATQDGREIANLSIATSESWKDKSTGERREKTEWHRVSIFNDGLVNLCKNYIKKGSKLYIEGKLQTRKWTDQQGVEKYSPEIVLQGYDGSITMLDSRSDSAPEQTPHNAAKSNGYQPQQAPSAAMGDDEIPF